MRAKSRTVTYGDRAFSACASKLWNELPFSCACRQIYKRQFFIKWTFFRWAFALLFCIILLFFFELLIIIEIRIVV